MRPGQLRHGAMRGFTLIEVLVALMIVMLVLGVFMAASLESIRGAGESARVEEALVRARSRLAMTAVQPAAGDFRGDDGGGYSWRVNTRVLDRFGKPPEQAETTLYAITVWVTWTADRRTREVRLDAERLFTPPPVSAGPPNRR